LNKKKEIKDKIKNREKGLLDETKSNET